MNAHPRRAHAGMSLVELMIAMSLGLLLVAAAGSVYLGNKQTYRTTASVAGLQDETRFAVMQLRSAIQHAGYYGKVDSSVRINGRRGSGSDLANLTGDCTTGWYIDLDEAIEFPDTTSGNPFTSTCVNGGYTKTWLEDTDMLVIRRAKSQTEDPTIATNVGKIFVRTDTQRGNLYIASATPPTGYNSTNLEDHRLVSELYFVSPTETDSAEENPKTPTLRRIWLTEESGTAKLESQKIARNIENFQVQLGEDINNDGSADIFTNPPDANPDRAVSVRFWLLIRSDVRESDYTDTNVYVLGDLTYTPPAALQHYRRTLVMQTVALRN